MLSGSAWQRGMPQGASGQPGGSLAAAASTEATHSGATSAKRATDTLVKYVKGMGPALVLPLPGQGLWIFLKAAWPGRKGEEVSCLLASFFAKDDDCFCKIYCVRDEKRICGII